MVTSSYKKLHNTVDSRKLLDKVGFEEYSSLCNPATSSLSVVSILSEGTSRSLGVEYRHAIDGVCTLF